MKRVLNPSFTRLAATVLAVACLWSTAQGDTIDIFADVNDTRNLEDLNPNDDIADSASGTGGFLLPGDIESDGNPREIRTTVGFALDATAQAAINTPGASVILAVQAILASDDALDLDLYGLDGKLDTIGVVGDYTGGTLLADALFSGAGDSGAQKVVGLTAFALANAANGALTFRFQGDGITLPNLDLGNDFWQITTPGASLQPFLRITFTPVPEPSTFTGLGVLAAICLTKFRRRS